MKSKIILTLFLLGISFLIWGAYGTTPSKQATSPKTLGEKTTDLDNRKKVLITKVIDGDTVETNTGEKIRYLGINTPEKGQPFYNNAKDLNKDLVLNKEARLELDIQNKDRFGRTLAYVFASNGDSDTFVNLEIVKKGLATSETLQPNVKYQDKILNAQKKSSG